MYSDITAWLVIDLGSSGQMPQSEEEERLFCGTVAHRKFRKANDSITPCIAEPGHKGGHVYCIRVRAGMDYHSHSLHYFEEEKRTALRPVMVAEMAGPRPNESDEECAALYQYIRLRGRRAT